MLNMNEMEFSIIIPVYNQEKYIEECLKSALNQKFNETYEIIVVNDGSTDKSGEILNKFKDEKLTVYNNENFGVSYSRNFALSKAGGKYIIFLDGDDYLSLDALQNFKETNLKANCGAGLEGNADIIFAPFYAIREKRGDVKLYPPGNIKENNIKTPFLGGNFEVCTKAYRKEFLTENNIEFLPLKAAEDLPFYYETMLKAKNVAVSNKPLYYYRKGHKAKFNTQAIEEVKKAILETDRVVKNCDFNFMEIKNDFLQNSLKVCFYWCKQFRKTEGGYSFYLFCSRYLKGLGVNFKDLFKFSIKVFISNLVDI